MKHVLVIGTALLSLSFSALAFDPSAQPASAGLLDEPVFSPNETTAPGANIATTATVQNPNLNSNNPDVRQQAVQELVNEEIEALEALPIVEVEERANEGERAAQIVLGTEFAKEAQSLSALPRVANQAAEDAVRWYSLAARRGFPGAASLDYAGVSFYPIRVQRVSN